MLTDQALDSAIPLTEILDSRNVVITPVENSPLATLVNNSRSDQKTFWYSDKGSDVAGVKNEGELVPNKKMITYMANAKDATFGVAPHDIEMDIVVEQVTKAVQEHVKYAKTVVQPILADLVSSVHRVLSKLDPSSLLGMEVITWDIPPPMTASALETSVRRFEEESYDNPRLNMKLPSMSTEDIVKTMKGGLKSVDASIDEWVSLKGEDFFQNLWENVFQTKQSELNEVRPVTFATFSECPVDGSDNSLAIFLLANNLLEKPPEGTEMSLTSYNRQMVDFRNQAAARICRILDSCDKNIKNKVLVRSVNGPKIVVNGDVYKKWIADGGSNEILFGNALQTPPHFTVDNINEVSAELKQKWTGHAAMTATIESNRKFTRIKSILLKEFSRQMHEMTDEKACAPVNKEMVIERFSDMLNELRTSDLDDLWGTCLKLICRSRFYHTEAECILEGIERVKKESPDVSVREAAAISVIEYISHWVWKQCRVTVLR